MTWAKTFEQQAARMKAALSKYVTAVHHVGSTAIPGIKSKPIVDIAIESSRYPPCEFIVGALASLGYVAHGEAGVAGRSWFSMGVPRVINLHWCPENGTVVQAQLHFRDALRAELSLAKEYEALKEKAAFGRHIDSAEYAEAKSRFRLRYY